jgi:hypothetical protein
MKVVAGIITHNPITNGRVDMLTDCVRSLAAEADEVMVVDNGSTDGSADWVESFGGTRYVADDGVTTCGRGMNVVGSGCSKRGDIVVLTTDDTYWRPGWRKVVEDFWAAAPDKVKLLCGVQEPEYPWSVPVGKITVGGVTGLLRPTVPSPGWVFRASDWVTIGPVPEQFGHDDVPTCQRLVKAGYLLVAVDITDHVGETASTWGNESYKFGRPLSCDTEGLTSLAGIGASADQWPTLGADATSTSEDVA